MHQIYTDNYSASSEIHVCSRFIALASESLHEWDCCLSRAASTHVVYGLIKRSPEKTRMSEIRYVHIKMPGAKYPKIRTFHTLPSVILRSEQPTLLPSHPVPVVCQAGHEVGWRWTWTCSAWERLFGTLRRGTQSVHLHANAERRNEIPPILRRYPRSPKNKFHSVSERYGPCLIISLQVQKVNISQKSAFWTVVMLTSGSKANEAK